MVQVRRGAPDLRTWELRGGKGAHIPCTNLGLAVGMGTNCDRHQRSDWRDDRVLKLDRGESFTTQNIC